MFELIICSYCFCCDCSIRFLTYFKQTEVGLFFPPPKKCIMYPRGHVKMHHGVEQLLGLTPLERWTKAVKLWGQAVKQGAETSPLSSVGPQRAVLNIKHTDQSDLFYSHRRATIEFHYNNSDVKNSVKIIIFISSKLYITIHLRKFILKLQHQVQPFLTAQTAEN